MVKDILSFFNDIQDYPGNKIPKNRQKATNLIAEDRYNGAKFKKYIISGSTLEMCTIGELAKALDKSPSTLRVWEHNGWLPKTKYRTPKPKGLQIPEKTSKGRRLYTIEQVEFMVQAMDLFNIHKVNHGDWNGFRKHIKDNWPQ